MMKQILIAHRGNIDGPNPELENYPLYITTALQSGYDVEIDVWCKHNKWFLGHDEPQYEVDFDFLRKGGLWLHAKDYQTLQQLTLDPTPLNFFYHTDEDYVLTSLGYIWAYPGKLGSAHTICVMPERCDLSTNGFAGICSDYISQYNEVNTI